MIKPNYKLVRPLQLNTFGCALFEWVHRFRIWSAMPSTSCETASPQQESHEYGFQADAVYGCWRNAAPAKESGLLLVHRDMIYAFDYCGEKIN